MATAELTATPTAARSRIAKISFACVLITFLIAGIFAVRNLATWPARLKYPGQEAFEGISLAEMARLRQGDHIYAAGADKSFAGATYGPLYYLLGSRLVNSDNPSYFPLRLLSMFAILGCAAGCALFALWLSGSYLAAALAPLIFLSYGMATDNGVTGLSDSMALFLFFAGFLVAFRFRYSKAILFSAPLMLLGFYYKPQYIAGPVAVFAFLLIEKQLRRAVEFAGLLASGGLAMLAAFQFAVFPGQAFWRHFLTYQAPLLSWHQFGLAAFFFALMIGPPLLLVVDFLRTHRDRMLACYLVCAVALAVFTCSKAGSGDYYFFECVLLVSAAVPALLAKRFAKRLDTVYVVVLLAIGVWAGHSLVRPTPKPADFAEYRAIQSYLRGHSPSYGTSLAFDPGMAMQAGLRTPYTDLYLLARLARRGVVSDRGLAEQIRAHRFAVVVLDVDLRKERSRHWLSYWLTEPVRDEIERNYALASGLALPAPERYGSLDRCYFYVPIGR